MGMRLRHRKPLVAGAQAAPALAWAGAVPAHAMPWQAVLGYRPRPAS